MDFSKVVLLTLTILSACAFADEHLRLRRLFSRTTPYPSFRSTAMSTGSQFWWPSSDSSRFTYPIIPRLDYPTIPTFTYPTIPTFTYPTVHTFTYPIVHATVRRPIQWWSMPTTPRNPFGKRGCARICDNGKSACSCPEDFELSGLLDKWSKSQLFAQK